MPDPWAEFHLEDIATEHATRHRSAVCPRGFEEDLQGLGENLGSCFWSKKKELIQYPNFRFLQHMGLIELERSNQLSLYKHSKSEAI